jgi:23S rRNA (pseudouridine1915-N3)-methyltransferase
MLTIHVITVGRDKEGWVSEQIEHYRKLISKYARLDITTVPEEKYGKGVDIGKAMAIEAKAIQAKLKGGYLFILDTKGKTYTTERFAGEIERLQVAGHSCIEFVIGGPHGLSPALKSMTGMSSTGILSFSPMTMSHQVTRLVLLEQLYRVLNLNAGGRYHK